MNKIMWPIIAGILLLTACQTSKPKAEEVKTPIEKPKQQMDTKKDSTFPYPNLLSSNDQTYSLLTIGEQDEQIPIEEDKTISKMEINILSLPTLDMVQKIYPHLSIENNSTYILFDNSKIVYQTKNLKELKGFLEKNPLN
jgi:hypothetical protein